MAWRGIVNRAFTAENVGEYLRDIPPPLWVQFIVVHNTGAPSLKTYRGYKNRANPVTDTQWLKNLEKYYRDQQRWKAGPHWFVTPNAKGLLAFTPSTVPGTHTPSWNSKSIGVEVVGDFDAEAFGPDTKRNLVALLAALHSWLGLSPTTLRFHKEDRATTHKNCPGRNINKAELIELVQEKMDETGGKMTFASLDMPLDNEGHDTIDTNEAGELPPAMLAPPETPVPVEEITTTQERMQQVAEAVATGTGIVYTVKSSFRSKISWLTGGLGSASATGAVVSDPDTRNILLQLLEKPMFWLAIVCLALATYIVYLRWREYGRGNPRNIVKVE